MPPSGPSDDSTESLDAELLQDTAATFAMLATPVRVEILWLLAHGEQDVSTLAEKTGQSLATVSHHLGKLRLAGLVRDQRDGRRRVYVAADSEVVGLVSGVIDCKLSNRAAGTRRRKRA